MACKVKVKEVYRFGVVFSLAIICSCWNSKKKKKNLLLNLWKCILTPHPCKNDGKVQLWISGTLISFERLRHFEALWWWTRYLLPECRPPVSGPVLLCRKRSVLPLRSSCRSEPTWWTWWCRSLSGCHRCSRKTPHWSKRGGREVSQQAKTSPGISIDYHATSPECRVIPDGFLVAVDGVCQRLAQRKTFLRQLNAGLEQLLPRHLAVSFVCQFIASDLTGHSDGQTT